MCSGLASMALPRVSYIVSVGYVFPKFHQQNFPLYSMCDHNDNTVIMLCVYIRVCMGEFEVLEEGIRT